MTAIDRKTLVDRAAGARLRGQADVRQVRHHHVLGTSGLQAADDADLVGHRRPDHRRRLGRVGDAEQIVGTAPHGVQGIGVGLATVGGQVLRGLGLERVHRHRRGTRGQGQTGIHAHAGATDGVVVAVLAVAVRRGIGAVVVGDELCIRPARVGGGLAGDRSHRSRQQRAEVAGVGQAVAEEHGLGIGAVAGQGGSRRHRQRNGQQGTDGRNGTLHGISGARCRGLRAGSAVRLRMARIVPPNAAGAHAAMRQ